MPDSLTAWGGYLIGILTVIVAVIRDQRKSDIDESTLILGKWKELVDQHQTDIKALKEEFATYKRASTEEFAAYKQTAIAEIADLRVRLNTAEKRIGELETENTGLKRAIAQNSQSTAFQLQRRNDEDDDMAARMDRAGHNLREAEQ